MVAEVGDQGSAQALMGLLMAEEIPARVESTSFVAGVPTVFRVLVDPRQAHRARWVLQPSEFTEAELDYLATGRLGGDSDDELNLPAPPPDR